MAQEKVAEWGVIKKIDIEPPFNYLSKKADVFNQNFPNGEMRCRVHRQLVDSKPNFFGLDEEYGEDSNLPKVEKDSIARLYIEVPTLDNYILQLLKVTYQVSKLYPCELLNCVTKQRFQCESPENFQEKVDTELSCDGIRERLSVLYSQL